MLHKFVCHSCAGVMLIFSVLFQLHYMCCPNEHKIIYFSDISCFICQSLIFFCVGFSSKVQSVSQLGHFWLQNVHTHTSDTFWLLGQLHLKFDFVMLWTLVFGCLTWNSHIPSKLRDNDTGLVLRIFHHLSRETGTWLGWKKIMRLVNYYLAILKTSMKGCRIRFDSVYCSSSHHSS